MIDDCTIKEILVEFESVLFHKEDYGYCIDYKANPTIVSTEEEAFILNKPSVVNRIAGKVYLDRVLINTKKSTRKEIRDIIKSMLKSYYSNSEMSGLEIVSQSFQRPGTAQKYLSKVEGYTDDVAELRFYAKGYPKDGSK